MSTSAESLYKNITLNDVQLASAYYPILIELAKHKHSLTYGELVKAAKEKYPLNPVVQNAIAVSAGRKLDVVRLFTEERGLPNIHLLIISKGSGECGNASAQNSNLTEREYAYMFDWSDVTTDFDGFIKQTEVNIIPRKQIKRPEALKLLSEYYAKHSAQLPVSIRDQRELVIELLMEGFSSVEAFSEAIKSGS